MARPTGRPIREELIAAASTMVQQVGVNSFSYGALAKQLGIAAPSIHHHFPTKDDLVGEVTARYRHDFAARRDLIDDSTAVDRIVAYAGLFAETSKRDLMCLCGSIASDWSTVGHRARLEAQRFFDEQLEWLVEQLQAGSAAKELVLTDDPLRYATALLAALEGSALMARASADPALAESVVESILKLLTP